MKGILMSTLAFANRRQAQPRDQRFTASQPGLHAGIYLLYASWKRRFTGYTK